MQKQQECFLEEQQRLVQETLDARARWEQGPQGHYTSVEEPLDSPEANTPPPVYTPPVSAVTNTEDVEKLQGEVVRLEKELETQMLQTQVGEENWVNLMANLDSELHASKEKIHELERELCSVQAEAVTEPSSDAEQVSPLNGSVCDLSPPGCW